MTTNFECVALALLNQVNQGVQILAEAVLADPSSEKRSAIATRLVELKQVAGPAAKAVSEFIARHTEETDQRSRARVARMAGGTSRPPPAGTTDPARR